jgi:hypothetical protein
MASEHGDPTTPPTVDLSGLPEPVVRDIKRLAESLRVEMPREVARARRPLRGRFADLNLSIPQEDLDAVRRDVSSGFPREFPEPGRS